MSNTRSAACWKCEFHSSGDGQNVEQGICRRETPRAHLVIQNGKPITVTIWPVVNSGAEWCGEFEPAGELAAVPEIGLASQ